MQFKFKQYWFEKLLNLVDRNADVQIEVCGKEGFRLLSAIARLNGSESTKFNEIVLSTIDLNAARGLCKFVPERIILYFKNHFLRELEGNRFISKKLISDWVEYLDNAVGFSLESSLPCALEFHTKFGMIDAFHHKIIASTDQHVMVRTRLDFTMLLPLSNIDVAFEIIKEGIFDVRLTKFLNSLIKKDWVVINCGANFGFFALLASRKVGEGGKVFAVEVNPAVFDFLLYGAHYSGVHGNMGILQTWGSAIPTWMEPISAFNPVMRAAAVSILPNGKIPKAFLLPASRPR